MVANSIVYIHRYNDVFTRSISMLKLISNSFAYSNCICISSIPSLKCHRLIDASASTSFYVSVKIFACAWKIVNLVCFTHKYVFKFEFKLIKCLQYCSTHWNTGYKQQSELQSRTSFVLYARTEQLANGNWNWKGGTAPDRARSELLLLLLHRAERTGVSWALT